MPIRVLIVEPDPETTLFLQDAMTELDGSSYWSHWTNLEPIYVGSWSDAERILKPASEGGAATGPVDIALMELRLPECEGADTFRRFQAIAADTPLILLTNEEEQPHAQRLLREGAQDFLLKSELDCAPLAHAIRNAMERHRLLKAVRAQASTDSLTGLLTSGAFLAAIERDRELARHHQRRMLLVLAEPCLQVVGHPEEDGTAGVQTSTADAQDLAVLRVADRLRALSGPLDLAGRLSTTRCGLAIAETANESLQRRWEAVRAAARNEGILLGAAVFDPKHPVSLEGLMRLAIADLEPGTSAAETSIAADTAVPGTTGSPGTTDKTNAAAG